MFSILQIQKKERNFPIPFAHSHLFIKFASILRHSGGLRRRTFKQKGVIDIIFIDEILAKFLCCEGDGSSTTSFDIYLPQQVWISSFGVGYCFIQQQRQCEKPHQ